METVIYFVMLVALVTAAFGGGAYLSWRLGISNKFISNRQLDKILAEQRVMRNLMDEEIAIIARDNDKDLASFDRQLNPPKIETVQGELVPQLPSPVTNTHDVIYSTEQRLQDEAVHRAFIKRMNEKANVYIQPSDHSADSNLRARNLKTGIMTYGHSMSCNCDRCLPLRHTAETVNCGCTTCQQKNACGSSPQDFMAAYAQAAIGPPNYLSGYPREALQQVQRTSAQAVLNGMVQSGRYTDACTCTISVDGHDPPCDYCIKVSRYCSICKGYCTASPPHMVDPRLSNKMA